MTTVDAAENRQFATGVDVIQSYKDQGRLGQYVIVQLGNYWSLTLETFSVLLEHMPQTGRVRVGILRNGRLGYGYFEL